jgi:hypothetical protein
MTEILSTRFQRRHINSDSATKDVDSGNSKNTDDAESNRGEGTVETVQVIDGAAERALCRKFDFRLLPVLALMVRPSRSRSLSPTSFPTYSLLNRR